MTGYHQEKLDSEDDPIAACRLLVAFALLDGNLDNAESDLLSAFSADFGYSAEQLQDAIGQITDQATAELVVFENIKNIRNTDVREMLAAAIFEICQADDVIHPNEKAFLETVERHWNVSIDFISKPIDWDDDQIAIVESPASQRMLVTAGPGMGKTAVACARVSYLIEKERVSPTNIWMISFTRAAVSELGDRIGTFASEAQRVLGVSVATIDSQAWQIRSGFDALTAAEKFGGYDTALSRAIEMIEENAEEYADFFGQMEHVIIDEAQDINGLRAQFMLKVLELIEADCGVTVFHDPAQAIYDYEQRAEDADQTKLVAELNNREFFTDGERHLKKIHRTEDPALLRLYEDLRLDVLSESTGRFDDQKAIVKGAAQEEISGRFEARNLAAYNSALVLFRTRAQAVMASSFMCTEGIPHRLRMANYPRCLSPWIALLFAMHDGPTISYDLFAERVADIYRMGNRDILGLPHPDPGVFAETAWEKLGSAIRRQRGDETELELTRISERLAKFPIDTFLRREIGTSGPILGTIHSSKGREADDVILNMPKSWSAGSNDYLDEVEEGRVLFVGASRARRRLISTDGLSVKYAQRLDASGRVFKKSPKWSACQVQLGLASDIDTEVSRINYGIGELLGMQLPLKCVAELTDLGADGWVWTIWPEDDELDRGPIGYFTKSFSTDLMSIGRQTHGKWKASGAIKNIYIVDWRTVARKWDGSGSVPPPSHLFSLAPVVAGFPMVFFK